MKTKTEKTKTDKATGTPQPKVFIFAHQSGMRLSAVSEEALVAAMLDHVEWLQAKNARMKEGHA